MRNRGSEGEKCSKYIYLSVKEKGEIVCTSCISSSLLSMSNVTKYTGMAPRMH